jgi:hypothetical protein
LPPIPVEALAKVEAKMATSARAKIFFMVVVVCLLIQSYATVKRLTSRNPLFCY